MSYPALQYYSKSFHKRQGLKEKQYIIIIIIIIIIIYLLHGAESLLRS